MLKIFLFLMVSSALVTTSTAVYDPPPWPADLRDVNTSLVLSHKGEDGIYSNFWRAGRDAEVGGVSSLFWRWWHSTDRWHSTDNSSIPSEEELNLKLPVKKPYWMEEGAVMGEGARMTWLGHSTVLAEIEGLNVLTDPMFSFRAAPVQFVGPARYRPAACKVSDLPDIAAAVISHTHYDHLDLDSIVDLVSSQPNIKWFVPSGLKAWMVDNTGVDTNNVREMVWWEEAYIGDSGVKVVFTPSNHWSKRNLLNMNKVLWGSWAVIGNNTKFWFGGDTAYCEAFKQIGDKFGPFTMAAIPIGAYEPRWFMKYSHVNPEEALQIHKDIGSQCSLGIHWATFKLTYEHYLAPRDELRNQVASSQLGATKFVTVDIGQSVVP